tara:strand:- start:11167 stop:12054 length:888 start_codon:yes stop_codon:yes gene_type:complete
MSGEDFNTGRQRGLGKGLAMLLGEAPEESVSQTADNGLIFLPIHTISPRQSQPRKNFNQKDIESLASSLKNQGIVQPLIVRPSKQIGKSEEFEIIAGERRWRAAQFAGLHEVPVVVKHLDDQSAMEVALVENLQREDLDPIEEAAAYDLLVNQYGNSHDAVADSVGKSRSYISNTLRLMGLPVKVKVMLSEKKITAGHARALLAAEDPIVAAELVIKKNLNVRQTEALVSVKKYSGNVNYQKPKIGKDPNILRLEKDLSNKLGLKVKITDRGNSGSLSVEYKNLEQLEAFIRRLS